ncbi:MAG: ankyrin repeat domain-containing protein [Candidatus Delongbacteria bacterium]|nr:ankyrin repeat domain-containing protein [Candidatus Delongbacteria bacterium]
MKKINSRILTVIMFCVMGIVNVLYSENNHSSAKMDSLYYYLENQISIITSSYEQDSVIEQKIKLINSVLKKHPEIVNHIPDGKYVNLVNSTLRNFGNTSVLTILNHILNIYNLPINSFELKKIENTIPEYIAKYKFIRCLNIVKVMELLLKHNSDLNMVKSERKNILYEFLRNRNLNKFAEYILNNGGVAYDESDNINYKLLKSVSELNVSDAKEIIKMGANVNFRDDRRYTPLAWSCYFAHKEMTQLLLDNGADTNQAIGYYDTPLNFAVRSNNINFVEYLLNNGAHINGLSDIGGKHYSYLPIIKAIESNNFDMIKFLVANSAKLDYESNDLIYAALSTRNINIIDYMIKNGVYIDPEKIYLNYRGYPIISDYLLKNNIISIFSDNFKESLYNSIEYGSTDVSEVFLRNGGYVHFSIMVDAVYDSWARYVFTFGEGDFYKRDYEIVMKYIYMDILAISLFFLTVVVGINIYLRKKGSYFIFRPKRNKVKQLAMFLAFNMLFIVLVYFIDKMIL